MSDDVSKSDYANGVYLSNLEACQNAYIEEERKLGEEIQKTLDPILAKCKTREDINTLQRELFKRMFDDLLHVKRVVRSLQITR